jgi:transcriptional regulator with XRE-family HTH domain
MTPISVNISYLRKQKRINQGVIARATGTTQTTISHWEKGICEPGIPCLIKLSDLFQVTVDQLIKSPIQK